MADISFSTDLTSIVESVLNNHEGRNDLAIVIQNGLTWQLTVDFNVVPHCGNYANQQGEPIMPAVTIPSGGGTVDASMYSIGFDATGNGCYVLVSVVAPSCAWAFGFATRPNATNQFQVMAWDWLPAQQDAYEIVKKSTQISANSGIYTDSTTIPGVTLTVSMTTADMTAATAEINFAIA